MIKKCLKSLGIFFSALIFFSCGDVSDVKIPTAIYIKSVGAAYSAPLGKTTVEMKEHFDVSDLRDAIKEEKVEVYDYNPTLNENDVQQFVFNYGLSEIPLDFDEYFSGLDLNALLEQGIDFDFKVPALNKSISENISLDFINEKIQSLFSGSAGSDIPVPELGATVSTNNLPDGYNLSAPINISVPAFSELAFSDGKLLINVTGTAQSPDFSMTVAAVLYSNDTEIARSNTADIANGGTLILSLDGVSLYPNMSIKLDGTISGGFPGRINTYNISCGISDVRLAMVRGLSIDSGNFEGITKDFTVPMGEVAKYLKKASIKNGKISLSAEMPMGWSGLSCDADIVLKNTITLNNDFHSEPGNYIINKSVDLEGSSIEPDGDMKVEITLAMSLENATMSFTNGSATIPISVNCSLSELTEAVVDASNLIDQSELKKHIDGDLSGDMGGYVKRVRLSKVGFKGDLLTENFPTSDLLLDFGVSSEFFNINDKKTTIDLSSPEKTFEFNAIDEPATINFEGSSKIGIDFSMGLKGKDSDYVTFSEIKLDTAYKFEAKIGIALEWQDVTLNTGKLTLNSDFDTGLNLDELLGEYLDKLTDAEGKSILEKVELSGLQAALLVTRPVFTPTEKVTTDPLDIISGFRGRLRADYTTNGQQGSVWLLGNTEETETFYIRETNASIKDSVVDNVLTDSSFFDSSPEGKCSVKADAQKFIDIVNKRPEQFYVHYEIAPTNGTIDELTITKDQVESLMSGAKTTINISVAIALPLQLRVVDDIKIDDVLELTGNSFEDNEDLLDRDSAEDSEDWTEYSNLVKKISLTYTFLNETALNFSARLVDEKSGLEKLLHFDNTQHTVELTSEEMSKILTTFPFQPKIQMTIYKTGTEDDPLKQAVVTRNANFGLEASILMITNGTYKVWSKD